MGQSVTSRVEAYERNVKAFVRRSLLYFGRRFRARMMTERIGGGPLSVMKVKSGRQKRSFRYKLVESPYGYRLEAQIGGGAAPYAQDHEDRGRLEFQNTFEQEAQSTLSAIETGLQFFERNPFGGQIGAAASGGAAEGGIEGGSAVGLGFQAIAEHFRQKRAAAKLRRQSSWRSIGRGS